MKNYIIPILIAFLLIGCKKKEAYTSHQKERFCLDADFKDKIEIIQVTSERVVEGIHLTGTVEANPDRVVHFVSLVNGLVSKTNFSLGESVSKGQVLAEMQSTELSALQAESGSLEAQIEVAKAALVAKQQLFDDKISSNKELLESKNHLRMLEVEKQKVQHNLSLFSASNSRDVFLIKAPTSGIITAKNINSGSTITDNGTVLFSISDLDEVWTMANIYAMDIVDITEGMEVEFTTISYPTQVFRGRIDAISQVLDYNAKVLKARITVDNKDHKLKPGMMADILALKKLDHKTIAIPTPCIVFSNNKNYVLVYTDDCNIQAREVVILTKNNGTTFIESGLSENEKIIAKNQLLIFEAL
ncbi:MAG TPA: efflux RND transporter periplasmic adaptor subunit [Flavobacterium sp.]|nr:efflux RND transporter periplasmic adaptor subunit [Flavobacterium sp.]